MRIVFAGTPEPALPSLRRLIDSPRHDVVAVLTRPDAAAGRRGKPSPSPSRNSPSSAASRVLRPDRPNSDEFVAELAELAPDCCAVVAYGALLRDGLLAVPRARLDQPALLAAARVAWCGAGTGGDRGGRRGDRRDDVPDRTGLDSGPGVRGRHRDDPAHRHRGGSPWPAVGFGCGAAGDDAGRHRRRTLSPVPQPADGVTVAPKITVDEARVRWDLPAHVVERRIRAVTPNPGAWTLIGDLRIKLGPVTVDASGPACRPGAIRVDRNGVRVGTASQPGAARHCSAAGQEADGRGGLGARRPPRRDPRRAS